MSSNYAGVANYQSTLPLMTDGDSPSAATFRNPLEDLLDNDVALEARISNSPEFTRTRFGFQDDFVHIIGSTADAHIPTGSWTWFYNTLGVGVCSVGPSLAGLSTHPGIARFTMAADSQCSFAAAANDTDPVCVFADFDYCECVVRVIVSLTGALFQFGIASTTQDMRTAANGAWFEFDNLTDPRLHARTRDGGSNTANVDLGVSTVQVLNDFVVLKIQRAANNDLLFYRNDVLVTTVLAATHSIDAADTLNFGFFFDTAPGTALAFDLDLSTFRTAPLGVRYP